MSAKERGLGRGLEALLGEAAVAKTEEPGRGQTMAAVGDLVPGPYQPRRRFDQSELEALADSVRQYGIMQPILVRADPGRPGGYQIVAGERRWRAAQLAQLHEVPITIRELEDRDALQIALIENVQREDQRRWSYGLERHPRRIEPARSRPAPTTAARRLATARARRPFRPAAPARTPALSSRSA